MLVEIDSAEQISPELIEAALRAHPRAYKDWNYKIVNLPTFDLRCEEVNLGIEFKYNADCPTSLYNGQLERELIQMVEWHNAHPEFRLHAICSGKISTPNRSELSIYTHFVSLCVKYHVIPHYRDTPLMAMKLAIALCKVRESPQEESYVAPKINKFYGLGPALSQLIAGLSAEFAQFVVDLYELTTVAQVVDLTESEWAEASLCYDGTRRDELCSKIYRLLNGVD